MISNSLSRTSETGRPCAISSSTRFCPSKRSVVSPVAAVIDLDAHQLHPNRVLYKFGSAVSSEQIHNVILVGLGCTRRNIQESRNFLHCSARSEEHTSELQSP